MWLRTIRNITHEHRLSICPIIPLLNKMWKSNLYNTENVVATSSIPVTQTSLFTDEILFYLYAVITLTVAKPGSVPVLTVSFIMNKPTGQIRYRFFLSIRRYKHINWDVNEYINLNKVLLTVYNQ
jgi:hypothetical protein